MSVRSPRLDYKNKISDKRKRVCLFCGSSFLSNWVGNRICFKCKTLEVFNSKAGYIDFKFPCKDICSE